MTTPTPGSRVTIPLLHDMKQTGRKIVGVVAWDVHMAAIADRAGVDIVSVGDTVGANLWGRDNPLDVTLDEMLVVCRAVRKGVSRALVSCDFPFGPLQRGPAAALDAAITLVQQGGVDLVKLDGASAHLEVVAAVARAGIPVFAQFGITPQTALHYGVAYASASSADAEAKPELTTRLVADARQLEAAGASLLDFTNSGPIAGAAAAAAVTIPVIGGFGGGPWLDGRMRMAHAAIGYAATNIDRPADTYANVAQITLDALTQYADDVRQSRQIKGARR